RVVGLAHAAHQRLDAAPIRERSRGGEEKQVAAGHEGGGQAARARRDLGVAGERAVAELAQELELHDGVGAQLRRPVWKRALERIQSFDAAGELDRMALAVIEADRLDARVEAERPR